jgi:uncharacterized protein (TIGR03437 family)
MIRGCRLCLFGLIIAAPIAAQSAEPYWQYVRTDSGVRPYAGGCYPDRPAALTEGAVRFTISFSPDCASSSSPNPLPATSYLMEWATPPIIIHPGKPVDLRLKTTVTANQYSMNAYGAGLYACFQYYDIPVSSYGCGGRPAAVVAGHPVMVGQTASWDNLALPAGSQYTGPPAWWGTDPRYKSPGGEMRFTYVAWGSSAFYWSYVYRLVEPKPKVTAAVSGASFRPGIAPGAWVTIRGENLADKTRSWGAADIMNGRLPTALDGVRVTIDGKAAFVYYISPSQLNVLAPDDIGTGNVRVEVVNSLGTSEGFTATAQRFAPGLFVFEQDGGKHVIAHTPEGTFLAKANLANGLVTRPARPDEVFTLYATGLGPTEPVTPADRVLAGPATTRERVTVRIAGLGAEVLWAGKVGSGLYQVNVRVPTATPAGEHLLIVEAGGFSSPHGTVITVSQ